MEGEYIVKTANHTFKMTVKRGVNYYFVNLGGNNPKLTCIDIFVYDNKQIAVLQQVSYDSQCNLRGDLSRGGGTVDMVCAALLAVKKLFPQLTDIKFDDVANIPCDNGRSVSLASYYLAFRRKTWYEMHFGAIPNTKDALLYQERKKRFDDPSFKSKIDWFDSLICNPGTDDKYHDYLKKTYSDSKTYGDFFDTLKNHFSRSELCIVTRSWIQTFMVSEIFNVAMSPWIIDLQGQFCQKTLINVKKISG